MSQTERSSGRWGRLADVRAADPNRPLRTFREQVWTDTRTGYFHADPACRILFRDEYEPGLLQAMLTEQGAIALRYWRCWTCYPMEESN